MKRRPVMRMQSLLLCLVLAFSAGCAAGGEWVFSRGSGRSIEIAMWDALSNAMLRGRAEGLEPGRIARAHEFMERSARRSWKDFGHGSQILGEPRLIDRMVQLDILFHVDPAGYKEAADAAMKRIERERSAEKDAGAEDLFAFEKLLLGYPRQYVTAEVLPGAAYDEEAGVYRAEVKVTLDGERAARLVSDLAALFEGKGLFEPLSQRFQMRYRHYDWRSRDEVRKLERKREFDFIDASDTNGADGVDFNKRYFENLSRSEVIFNLATEFDIKKRRLVMDSFFVDDGYAEVLQRSTQQHGYFGTPNAQVLYMWRIRLDLLDADGRLVATRDNAPPLPYRSLNQVLELYPVLHFNDENHYAGGYLYPGKTEFVMNWQIFLTPEEAERVHSVQAAIHYPDDRRGNSEVQPLR